MLEIILVIILSQRLGNRAKAKGLSGAYGWLFALGWVLGEIVGGILGVLLTEEFFIAYMIALAGAVSGGFGAWMLVSNLPPVEKTPSLGAVAAPTAAPARAPYRRAGYCMDCDKNVWITESGSCPEGHGPQSISGVYNALDG